MLLLRFQMCAVVNRIAVLHVRHRHGKSRMPRVVTITDEPNLSTTSRINSRIRWRSRSPFNSHRKAASPKPAAVLHLRYRHRKSGMPRVVMITDERAKSFGGNFTHSHVRRRRHDRRSTRIETRHRQCATRPNGNRPNSAQRLLLSNTRASDVTAAAAGIK